MLFPYSYQIIVFFQANKTSTFQIQLQNTSNVQWQYNQNNLTLEQGGERFLIL